MPGGNIYVGFYLERQHEFDSVVHEFSADGRLGKELSHTLKEGVCRQMQSAIVMSPAAARAIANGILTTLDKLDALDFVSQSQRNEIAGLPITPLERA